ncbi:MAG TPA: histidine kinase dimerization/phospho-acceptor domain-containing protein, partial [Bacteroidales bacterium]
MRLQNKINIRFLLLIVAVFSLAGVVLYFMLDVVVDRNIDDMLENKAHKIKHNLRNHPIQEARIESPDQSVTITRVNQGSEFTRFSDTLIYDKHDRENLSYRKMFFGMNADGKWYEVSISISRLEAEDMIEVTFYFMLGLFAFIALVLFLLNRWLSTSVWKPFFRTLGDIKIFKISNRNEIVFEKSNVYEFTQLNEVLTEMMQKIRTDFTNLKAFTENASHEMQTPLAVMKSKLEMTLQDKTLSSERYHQVRTAYEAASRLSKLNEALLLLSKIENKQFVEEFETNLCNLIMERLDFIEELIALKKVTVSVDLTTQVTV